ncbi:hypothetical protein [Sphingomicrobium astaxanthinifaciens]|uniref:hypothetical protein n=1 Tax=Sphingomicrobium astaxanthinifaciens TaxID=1227949 RepID=UPI001FCB98EA|nr:hypothetical protein [Sphingomicrobium astaxanthinifaciens]MCJ7421901.1 hypothetical protein [Sphingomicrobium astaxanthinifaciens]
MDFDLKHALARGGRTVALSWALAMVPCLLFAIVVADDLATFSAILGGLALAAFKLALRMQAAGAVQAVVAPLAPQPKAGRVRDVLFYEDPQGRDPMRLLEPFGALLREGGAHVRSFGDLQVRMGDAYHVVTPAPHAKEMSVDTDHADASARAAFLDGLTAHLRSLGVAAGATARPDPEPTHRRRAGLGTPQAFVGFGRRGR